MLLWNQCTFSYNPSKIFARARFVQTQPPWNLRGFLFEYFSPLKEENINIERVNIFCKHNYSSSYSQLLQISQSFENVFRKLPDSVVLQPSDKKNNTAMIGKSFHIFQLWWVFRTKFRNTILVNILTFFWSWFLIVLIGLALIILFSYWNMHHRCALLCSFIH